MNADVDVMKASGYDYQKEKAKIFEDVLKAIVMSSYSGAIKVSDVCLAAAPDFDLVICKSLNTYILTVEKKK